MQTPRDSYARTYTKDINPLSGDMHEPQEPSVIEPKRESTTKARRDYGPNQGPPRKKSSFFTRIMCCGAPKKRRPPPKHKK